MPTDTADVPRVPASSPAPLDERITELRDLFPEAFTDGVLDPQRIAELVGADAGPATEEAYRLTWAGKGAAQRALAVGSTATLRPDLTASTHFDDAQNVFVEGDNLEVLRLLQRGYNDKFKLIYIDPPYNTGNDFVYQDDFSQGLDAYLRYTGQVNDDGTRKSSTTETAGRRHSGWLTMMYPRLALARNLLTEDGSIFVSIDDNEVHNLRLVMDEVFGPENFIGQFIWAAGRKNDSKFISQSHEYMLAYARSASALKRDVGQWRTRKGGLEDIYAAFERFKRKHGDDHDAISTAMKGWYKDLPDNDPAKRHAHYNRVDARGLYFPADISWPGGGGPRYEVLHPVTGKPVAIPSRGWIFSDPARMQEHIDLELVHFGADETAVPCKKSHLVDREYEVPYSVFYQDGRGATKRLRTLLGGDYFENPKDETVLQKIVEFATDKDDLVLDFFAGSGSFAHAVMAQNEADGGSRRFVLVTLDEPTPDDSKARDAGIETIPGITRLRLANAAHQVHGDAAPGIRCLRLATSNFATWDVATAPTGAEALAEQLTFAVDNLDESAPPESIVVEVMLKDGLRLDEPWHRIQLADGEAVIVADHTVVCLHDAITTQVVDEVESLGIARCVMLERAFAGRDQDKSNAFYRFRDAGIAFRTI